MVDLKSLARVHTESCVRVLASIVTQVKAPASARAFAANSLLDRGWGKAPQQLVGEDGGDIRIVIRQIIENVAQTVDDDPKLIEHDDDPATP
jgi:hypothetical protein